MLLVLVLALSAFPVTAGAASSGKRITGSQAYTTNYYEYEPNNTKELADWFDAEDAYVDGEVGQVSAGDTYDWYYFTISRDNRLYFLGTSGAGGTVTTRFCLYDESGSLIKTIDYYGEDPHDPSGDDYSDDIFYSEVDLRAGKYYVRVNDPTYWVGYSFETMLIPMYDAPVLSATNKAASGKVVLNWNADAEVEETGHYFIQRATSKNGSYSTIATVAGNVRTYEDTTARAGTTYYYRVIADPDVVYIPSFPSNIVSRTCDLPRPTGIKATRSASTGKVTVSWNKVTGADKYSVYYSTDGSTYNLLKTVTGTSLTHSSAPLGKTVYYKIVAVDADKSAANSAKSTWVKGTAVCARPEITVSNVASTGKVKISWGKVTGASKYTLYIYDASGTLLKSTNTTGTSLTHSSAVAGKTYTYKVKAIGSVSGTNSAVSAAKDRTCDLAAPTLSVSKNSAGKPVISWNKVSGAGKYSVYYSTDGGSTYSLLKTVTSTSLTHSSAAAGKTYRYKVKAVYTSNTAANSAYSNAVSYKVAGSSSLAAPTASISTSGGKPVISWTKVTGATQYKVYCSTDGGSSWTLLKTVTGTTLTHSSAVKGTTYSYRVKAVSDSATSANSNVVSVTSR